MPLKQIACIIHLFLFSITISSAQTIPTPKEHFGFTIGDNYQLATYTQTEAYFKKVAAASNRTKLVDIGKTEEGRSQYMMIITSPANQQKLDRYKEISGKLAHAENLTDQEAQALAAEGKTVVWIDGGLHATEVVGAHQHEEIGEGVANRALFAGMGAQDPAHQAVDHGFSRVASSRRDGAVRLPRLSARKPGGRRAANARDERRRA